MKNRIFFIFSLGFFLASNVAFGMNKRSIEENVRGAFTNSTVGNQLNLFAEAKIPKIKHRCCIIEDANISDDVCVLVPCYEYGWEIVHFSEKKKNYLHIKFWEKNTNVSDSQDFNNLIEQNHNKFFKETISALFPPTEKNQGPKKIVIIYVMIQKFCRPDNRRSYISGWTEKPGLKPEFTGSMCASMLHELKRNKTISDKIVLLSGGEYSDITHVVTHNSIKVDYIINIAPQWRMSKIRWSSPAFPLNEENCKCSYSIKAIEETTSKARFGATNVAREIKVLKKDANGVPTILETSTRDLCSRRAIKDAIKKLGAKMDTRGIECTSNELPKIGTVDYFKLFESLPENTLISSCRFLQEQGTDCCVCMEPFTLKKNCFMPPCGHLFCKECIIGWIKKNSVGNKLMNGSEGSLMNRIRSGSIWEDLKTWFYEDAITYDCPMCRRKCTHKGKVDL